jgi:hypothetical protein
MAGAVFVVLSRDLSGAGGISRSPAALPFPVYSA